MKYICTYTRLNTEIYQKNALTQMKVPRKCRNHEVQPTEAPTEGVIRNK